MTYFTINDPVEPVEIKDGRGMCGSFCVGANLDESDQEDFKNDENSGEKNIKYNFDLKENVSKRRRSSTIKAPSGFKKAFFGYAALSQLLMKI